MFFVAGARAGQVDKAHCDTGNAGTNNHYAPVSLDSLSSAETSAPAIRWRILLRTNPPDAAVTVHSYVADPNLHNDDYTCPIAPSLESNDLSR